MKDVFEKYLKTDATIKTYKQLWNTYQDWTKLKPITPANEYKIKDDIIAFTDYLVHKNLNPRSIRLYLDAIKFYFDMNDIILNWKKIKRLIPIPPKRSGSTTWTDNEIKMILKSCKFSRDEAILFILISTGCRKGAIPDLNHGDMEILDGGFSKLKMYRNTNDEYDAFLTPQATKAVIYYNRGHDLNPNTPLIRKKNGQRITEGSINHILNRITEVIPREKVDEFRYNIQLAHGFRKWYGTKIKMNPEISHSVAERLLGHKAGLDENYFVPGNTLLDKFKLVSKDLMI